MVCVLGKCRWLGIGDHLTFVSAVSPTLHGRYRQRIAALLASGIYGVSGLIMLVIMKRKMEL